MITNVAYQNLSYNVHSCNVLLEVLALLFDKLNMNYVVKNNESAS